MENNLSEEFLNIPVREPNLLNGFFSDNPKADVEIVKLFISDEVLGDILIIKGEPGNGKRHLLQGAANELLKNDIKIVFPSPSPSRLFTIVKNDKDSLEKSLQDCSFCLIDYLDNITEYHPLRTDSPQVFNWLQEILTEFIKRGGRIIFSARKEITSKEISNYFKTDSVIEANTSYPSLETLKLIGKQHYSNEFVEKYAEEAYEQSSCVRVFMNRLLISYYSLLKLSNPF